MRWCLLLEQTVLTRVCVITTRRSNPTGSALVRPLREEVWVDRSVRQTQTLTQEPVLVTCAKPFIFMWINATDTPTYTSYETKVIVVNEMKHLFLRQNLMFPGRYNVRMRWLGCLPKHQRRRFVGPTHLVNCIAWPLGNGTMWDVLWWSWITYQSEKNRIGCTFKNQLKLFESFELSFYSWSLMYVVEEDV